MPKYPKGTRPLTQAEKRKESDKSYRARLKILRKFGIYNPTGTELTRYRKHEINRLTAEFHDVVVNPQKYLKVDLSKLKRSEKAQAKAKAKELNMAYIGSQSIVIGAEGHTSARIRYYKKEGEFGIIKRGRVKKGVNSGKSYKTYLSLGGLDAMEKQKRRLTRQAARLGAVRENQTLAFRVIKDGEVYGHSRHTYEDVDLLIEDLERYHTNLPQNIAFFRMIEIDKVEYFNFKAERDDYEAKRKARKKRLTRRERIKGRS